MNQIINKRLLAGDKFMPELDLLIVLLDHLLKNSKIYPNRRFKKYLQK